MTSLSSGRKEKALAARRPPASSCAPLRDRTGGGGAPAAISAASAVRATSKPEAWGTQGARRRTTVPQTCHGMTLVGCAQFGFASIRRVGAPRPPHARAPLATLLQARPCPIEGRTEAFAAIRHARETEDVCVPRAVHGTRPLVLRSARDRCLLLCGYMKKGVQDGRKSATLGGLAGGQGPDPTQAHAAHACNCTLHFGDASDAISTCGPAADLSTC